MYFEAFQLAFFQLALSVHDIDARVSRSSSGSSSNRISRSSKSSSSSSNKSSSSSSNSVCVCVCVCVCAQTASEETVGRCLSRILSHCLLDDMRALRDGQEHPLAS